MTEKALTAVIQEAYIQGIRDALGGRSGRRVVSAFIATAFAQDDADAAKVRWRKVADRRRPKVPKLLAKPR